MQIICFIFAIKMNLEYFIAKRLFTAKKKNNTHTQPIFRIAILAIALSVAIMLLSLIILTGFKNEITSKVIGFGSHITISKLTDNQSYESDSISIQQDFYPSITKQDGIKHISIFASKVGMAKTKDETLGVVFKGVATDYDWSFFQRNLIAGKVFSLNDSVKSNSILISESISKTLKLGVDDDLVMYFVQNPPRVRKFKIAGIYNTAFPDFDKLFVLGDIEHIRTLNSWQNNEVGGFEITIDNFDELDKITANIDKQIPYYFTAQSIKKKAPLLFDWLDLLDMNLNLILILTLIVGAINMITALLILILERTRLIGVLKALGALNWSVRKVFLYSAVRLMLKGLLLGNAIGLGFAFLQKKFLIISLDSEIYYMDTVPIYFDFTHILLLNIGTIIVCYLILIIPSIIITKITPVKAIRFE